MELERPRGGGSWRNMRFTALSTTPALCVAFLGLQSRRRGTAATGAYPNERPRCSSGVNSESVSDGLGDTHKNHLALILMRRERNGGACSTTRAPASSKGNKATTGIADGSAPPLPTSDAPVPPLGLISPVFLLCISFTILRTAA